MWDGFNKRKFPRVNLRCEITIHPEPKNKPILTMTQNLGVGGVCAILDQPLERFSKCRIRLELDENMPPIACEGKIVWIVPTKQMKETKSRFDTGVEFLDMDPQSEQKIKSFIKGFTQKVTPPQKPSSV